MGLIQEAKTPRSSGSASTLAPPMVGGNSHAEVARRGTVRALLAACRPAQWSKNALVVAAPGAAGVLFKGDQAGRVAVAFASFCLLASCTYLLNDLHDLHEDRLHHFKCRRPLASGELSARTAWIAALLLGGGGVALAAVLGWSFIAIAAGYLILTGSYSLLWRRIAVADIAVVAAGFVLRAVAGGIATHVPLSRWFVIVASFGALFLVAAKRYAELVASGAASSEDLPAAERVALRRALHAYSAPYLRFVMILAASVAVGSYCLWAFQHRAHSSALLDDLTILPMVLWLMRYALLVDGGAGEAPERLVLKDPFLLSMAAIWVGTFAGAVYAGG